MIVRTLCLFSLFFINSALAAPKTSLQVKPKNILLSEGALQGGKAGIVTSLLDLRETKTKDNKQERVVVDIGDSKSQKLIGRLGYYTVELRKNNQMVLNFNQTLTSKFSEKELQSRFKTSAFVKNAKMIFDPTSQTTSLILDFKKAVAVKVISVGGAKQTGKLVVDLTEKHQL
jgi:hypothetical protein